MGLSLVVGPAHAGKVALLLDRYLDEIEHDPWLIVPIRSDVERIELDLLGRTGVLLRGRIGTFDDLFQEIADFAPDDPGEATAAVRELVVRRAVRGLSLNDLATSAQTAGFADALLAALGELGSALLDAHRLDGDLATLHAAYGAELDRLGLRDRDATRRRAVERLRGDLDAWRPGRPVFAYGFEDLTAAEWGLLEALAARTDVHVSIPYEPGRVAFASLAGTVDDLAGLAAGRIVELTPATTAFPPALRALERGLFEDAPGPAPPLDGAVRFLEGAGTRGTLELVGETIGTLVRSGMPPERVGIVCDSVERWRAPIDATFGALGIPHVVEDRQRLTQTPFGAALLSLLRFAWLGGDRADLFVFLRSPFSGVQRRSVDFVEGRLRGRAVRIAERVEEEGDKLRGSPVSQLVALREAPDPVTGAAELVRTMATAAFGLEAPPTGDEARLDLACHEAAVELLDELARLQERGVEVEQREIVAALERRTVRAVGAGEPDRVAVLDLLRSRTRSFDAVFVLGLEEGSLPRLAVRLRSSTTTGGRRSALASRSRIRSAATGTSSTRPAPARRIGSRSCGRLRPTTASRARQARSGTR